MRTSPRIVISAPSRGSEPTTAGSAATSGAHRRAAHRGSTDRLAARSVPERPAARSRTSGHFRREDFDGVQAVAWCNRVGISLDDLLMVSMVAERLCGSILMTTAPTPSSTL